MKAATVKEASSSRRECRYRTFSYVVPTYNRPRELSDCLKSVLSQTVRPDELIVVSDGDVDELPYRAELERAGIRCVLYRKTEPGLTASRNAGVRLASGDVICFTDDDVVLHPDYFEKLLQTYREHDGDGRLMGVGGHVANFKPHDVGYMIRWFYDAAFMMGGFHEGRVLPSGFTVDPCEVPVLAREPFDVQFLSGCSMSFRRELFDEFSFSEDYKGYGLGEDKDFCCRVSRVYRLMINPAAKLDHHESPQMRHAERQRGRESVVHRFVFFRDFARRRWWNWACFWYAMSGYLLIRLAVRLAIQPDANLTRALAMSTLGVSTGTPIASPRSSSCCRAIRWNCRASRNSMPRS